MKKQAALVLTAYLLLTVALTWPATRFFTQAIPGDGFDGWQNYWNLWWVKQALLVERTSPFFTDYLDAPSGVSLLFHTLNIFNGLWTLPLQLNFGLAAAYNAVVLASFTLAGYGAYLLTLFSLSQIYPAGRGLRAAAFVGGLIFTMSPFHMAHLLGHMQVFSMIWPPFYILWLLRTLQPWQPGEAAPPPQLGRNTAITGLFLVLAALVDWYHSLYLLLFTGATLLWLLWRNRRDAPAWRNWRDNGFYRPLLVILAVGAIFALALSPLLGPMIRDASSRPDLETGLEQNIALSADLLAFVLPSEMHPLWGEWAKSIAANFTSTTSERLVFAGFGPLALALLALITGWRWPAVKFWALLLAGFGLLALGPYLHVGGRVVSPGGWPLPLPYLLLYNTIPFINLTRSLSRYDLMIMLSLGVLAAVGLVRLNTRWRRWPAAALPLVAAGLVCVEFVAAPYPVSPIDIPQFYADISADPERYTIAELPLNWDRPTPLLHQTVHGKRLLTAYTSRDNPRLLAPKTPVLQQWRFLGPDIIDQPLADIAPTVFYDFNLRYIVLDYWQMPPGPERAATEKWVAAALPNAAPIYDDGRLQVYASPPKTETRPYLSLGEGWGERTETNGQIVTRSIEPPGAELFVHHPPAGQLLSLQITATGTTGQMLRVLVGETLIGEVTLSPQGATTRLTLPPAPVPPLILRLLPTPSGGQVKVSHLALSAN